MEGPSQKLRQPKTAKPKCLLVASGHETGFSGSSFVHCVKIASSAFNVEIATPRAEQPVFVDVGVKEQRWLDNVAKDRVMSTKDLSLVDDSDYAALLIPNGHAVLWDLVESAVLGRLVGSFVSQGKMICALGNGVAGLLPASTEDGKWALAGYCLTGATVCEEAALDSFGDLPVVVEDAVKMRLGVFSGSTSGSVHVVIDRTLITGQNDASTLIAVQNLILMHNAPTSRG